jgi:hypothetical protein
MTDMQAMNPFQIGERVTFLPDDRTIGWARSYFDRQRLQPGDTGTVTRIDQGVYLYLDDDRGGFHRECFKKAA